LDVFDFFFSFAAEAGAAGGCFLGGVVEKLVSANETTLADRFLLISYATAAGEEQFFV
jgi:hypothetical protein